MEAVEHGVDSLFSVLLPRPELARQRVQHLQPGGAAAREGRLLCVTEKGGGVGQAHSTMMTRRVMSRQGITGLRRVTRNCREVFQSKPMGVLIGAQGSVEDGPPDLGAPCVLVVRVVPTNQVVLADRPVNGERVLADVGRQRAVRTIDVCV